MAVQESFSTISEEKKLQTTLIRTAAMVAVDMNILDREAYLAYMQRQCLGQLKSIGTGEPAARVWAEKLVESIQSTVDFIELHGGTKSGNA